MVLLIGGKPSHLEGLELSVRLQACKRVPVLVGDAERLQNLARIAPFAALDLGLHANRQAWTLLPVGIEAVVPFLDDGQLAFQIVLNRRHRNGSANVVVVGAHRTAVAVGFDEILRPIGQYLFHRITPRLAVGSILLEIGDSVHPGVGVGRLVPLQVVGLTGIVALQFDDSRRRARVEPHEASHGLDHPRHLPLRIGNAVLVRSRHLKGNVLRAQAERVALVLPGLFPLQGSQRVLGVVGVPERDVGGLVVGDHRLFGLVESSLIVVVLRLSQIGRSPGAIFKQITP